MNKKMQEKILKNLPSSPGIYLFFDASKELLYVGKATNLKSRVSSYFRGAKTSRPIEQMMHEVELVEYQETESVLEAIILEANTIAFQNPKYNILGKDNKSWNYLCITRDEYPRIILLRQHEMKQYLEEKGREVKNWKIAYSKEYDYVFGPFPGVNTKAFLKLLRKLFHYSDCKPKSGKPCLYRQMDQCLGVCTGEITGEEYKKQVISPMVSFLKGNKKYVIGFFEKEMRQAAREERYEDAGLYRDQVKQLQRIYDVTLLNKQFFEDEFADKGKDFRIEGYDISNLGSTGKVGSMVVFEKGRPKKSDYRKFTIKSVVGQSDVDCLEEVIVRRLAHLEWQYPDVFLIDGGKPQVNKVKGILKERNIRIPVVGIAKGPTRKKNEFIFGQKNAQFILWVQKYQDLLVQVRDEAHRFAINFQRSKRRLKK